MHSPHRRWLDPRPATRGGGCSTRTVRVSHVPVLGVGIYGCAGHDFGLTGGRVTMYAESRVAQRVFKWRTWGGKRKGAGRKPAGERAGVAHVERAVLAPRFPVHATWRMSEGVWNLRTRRCFGALERAMFGGATRFG